MGILGCFVVSLLTAMSMSAISTNGLIKGGMKLLFFNHRFIHTTLM